jgi:hypothetical protein
MMGTIYGSSHTVFVCLGGEDWLSDKATEFALRLSNIPTEQGTAPRDRDLDDLEWHRLRQADDDDFRGSCALSHRSWFHRAWVVQEIVSGHEAFALCGTGLFSFAVLNYASRFLVNTNLHLKIAQRVMK